MALTLTSSSFKEGATLRMNPILSADYGFGCGGGNKGPQLSWSGVPAGARSFAVHCFDPDAPTGSGFWHCGGEYSASATELKLDAGNPASGLLPGRAADPPISASQDTAPCPQAGPHRYQFTRFAVKQDALPVNADTSAAIVGLHSNTIEGDLTGVFGGELALAAAAVLL